MNDSAEHLKSLLEGWHDKMYEVTHEAYHKMSSKEKETFEFWFTMRNKLLFLIFCFLSLIHICLRLPWQVGFYNFKFYIGYLLFYISVAFMIKSKFYSFILFIFTKVYIRILYMDLILWDKKDLNLSLTVRNFCESLIFFWVS